MRIRRCLALLTLAGCTSAPPLDGSAPRSAADSATSAVAKPPGAESNEEAAVEPSRLPIVESLLGTVPVKVSQQVPADHAEFVLEGFSGGNYGELERRAQLQKAAEGRVRVSLSQLQSSDDAVQDEHRRCSFLIDCDEPPVVDLANQAKARLGPLPDISALSRFVDETITDKSLKRSLDLPSQTAVSRSGDCTEHSFLLVALARRFDFAARAVSGLVVITPAGEAPHEAFGHAWVEVHDGRRWRRVDPALGVGKSTAKIDPPRVLTKLSLDASGKRAPFELYYLPLDVQRNESPSYGRADQYGLTVLHVAALWWHGQPTAESSAFDFGQSPGLAHVE